MVLGGGVECVPWLFATWLLHICYVFGTCLGGALRASMLTYVHSVQPTPNNVHSAFEKEAVSALRDAEKAQSLTEDAEERTQVVEARLGEAREVQAAAVAAVREAATELKYVLLVVIGDFGKVGFCQWCKHTNPWWYPQGRRKGARVAPAQVIFFVYKNVVKVCDVLAWSFAVLCVCNSDPPWNVGAIVLYCMSMMLVNNKMATLRIRMG